MTEPVLRRKLVRRRPPAASAPVPPLSAPAQALPRALVRAISAAAGLTAQTAPVADRRLPLAEALDRLDEDGLLALLAADGASPAATGLMVLGPDLFAALVEALTVGRLGPAPAGGPRRATATDAALLGAVIDRTLAEVDRALADRAAPAAGGAGSDAAGPSKTGPWKMIRGLSDARLLPAALDDGTYRLIETSVTLSAAGGTTRGGRVALLLPDPPEPRAEGPPARGPGGVSPDAEAFARALERAVQGAPARLTGVLARLTLPLERALALDVGQRLEMPCSVLEEVALVGPTGATHAVGRLGQARGMRAVRILVLADDPALPAAGAAEAPAPPPGLPEPRPSA